MRVDLLPRLSGRYGYTFNGRLNPNTQADARGRALTGTRCDTRLTAHLDPGCPPWPPGVVLLPNENVSKINQSGYLTKVHRPENQVVLIHVPEPLEGDRNREYSSYGQGIAALVSAGQRSPVK
ncbi:hypothetical protein NP493_72g03045 [Ridgeia piscesae]|uniref:Uncharacterized protein n=1 Tax=Ridgeia piscesae TaxID=27915 RepID=A0AAD9P9D7_RIDPI|nr:hypothetical protein NP493_72g03045 [Ridgeia piscesae]